MNNSNNIEGRIRKVICEQLGTKEEEVTPTASIVDDLGADSLDTVELVMSLEEEFELEISDQESERLSTVQQIIDYVNNQVPATV